ncbi:MAG: cytochrome c family protein [Desulfobacterales bacterium]|nr:cytochrome c family protein [Desulfobacterales bacterium]
MSSVSAAVRGTAFDHAAPSKPLSPDIFPIDLPGGPKEMPGVNFPHDLHNRAMDGNCDACHPSKKGKPLFRFKRSTAPPDMDYQTLYHDECVGCHTEMKGKPPSQPETRAGTGPLEAQCRDCHNADPPRASARLPLDFDRSLHFRHESSPDIPSRLKTYDTNCSACHHSANDKTLETFYENGKEGACIYCHTPEGKGEIRNNRRAAHDSCVACHLQLNSRKKNAGPVNCNGCHQAQAQAKIEKLDDLPRLQRNQPDAILITGWLPLGKDTKANQKKIQAAMDPVPFNHEFHETQDIGCKSCHHAALEGCKNCHSPGGKKAGNFIKLADAMHSRQSNRSCQGCHTSQLNQKECAGCHTQILSAREETNCKACHNFKAQSMPQRYLVQPQAATTLAKAALIMRREQYKQLPREQIPQEVVIDTLVREYKPSKFPHEKVVNTLMEATGKSALAKAFHGNELTQCTGCHHHSPPSLTPPKCASCHGREPDPATGKPGLKGAYHGQCIGCHQEMDIASVRPRECVKCHEKK